MTEFIKDDTAIAQLEAILQVIQARDPKDRLDVWIDSKETLADVINVLQALTNLYVNMETNQRISLQDSLDMFNFLKYMAVNWYTFAISYANTVNTKPKPVEKKKTGIFSRLFS